MRRWTPPEGYPRSMSDRWVGNGDVTYFSMMVVMADHVAGGPKTQRRCKRLALERLVDAIAAEATARDRCRDTDVKAATRTRAWR